MPSATLSRFVELGNKVPGKIREVGLLYTAATIFRRLSPFDTLSFFLCELDLHDSRHNLDNDPEIRPGVFPDDTDSFLALGAPASRLPAKPEPDTQFWVLEQEGKPIAYMWLEPGDFDLDVFGWLRIKTLPNDIRGIKLWVAPGHRRRGIGPRMNRHCAAACAHAGYSRIVSIVDGLNRNSLRADRKVGYKIICHVRGLRFAGVAVIQFGRCLRFGRRSSSRPLEMSVVDFEHVRASELS